MALTYADRVLETTTSTGTGALTLGGALTGYQAFSDALTNADTVYYSVFAVDGSGNPSGDWETGLGTYSSGTLTRTTVQSSSNSGSAVDFASGTKWVMATATAAAFDALPTVPATTWDFNFAADGYQVIRASEAMTITQQATSGTGSVAYEKSTNAAPDTFSSTASPVTLEAGAKLKVTASSVVATYAVHLERTA